MKRARATPTFRPVTAAAALLSRALVTWVVLALFWSPPSAAADCPPDERGVDVRPPGSTETPGEESVTLPGHVRPGQRLNRAPSEAPDEARARAEIMPLFTAMQAAANVHDAEAHLAPFVRSPDLTFVVNGRIIRGWDNLLAQQRAWWPAGRIPLADEAHRPYPIVEGPDFRLLGPRHAVLTFVMNARRIYPDRVTRRPLAVSQLWEKREEGWRIVHAHESIGPESPEQ